MCWPDLLIGLQKAARCQGRGFSNLMAREKILHSEFLALVGMSKN